MYELVTGPLAWLSFLIFFVGVIVRIVFYIRGLDWKLDRVTYSVNTSYGVRAAIRSVLAWLIPFGTRSWRMNPGFATLFFLFHFGLLFTPVFLLAHNMWLQDMIGFGLPAISGCTADFLTILVLVCAGLIVLRRIALPEVRILTDAADIMILIIAIAPFITGYLSAHTTDGGQFWTIIHVLCGEIWLVAIPFTKLSHFVLFFMSRIQLGMDFGIKRGGMKGSDIVW